MAWCQADYAGRLEKLLSKVQFDTNGGCWLWEGGPIPSGYSQIIWDGKMQLGHRISYEEAFGKIPEGMCVCHRCDTPPCVNPDHLFLGTKADNNEDKRLKGRQVMGDQVAGAKLNDAMALEIVASHRAGEPIQALADKFGVTFQAIWALIKGRTYKHLGAVH